MKDRNRNLSPIEVDGLAALGICESLLLALSDAEILNDKDVRDLLGDVVTTHMQAAGVSATPERHNAVVAIIQRIIAGNEEAPHASRGAPASQAIRSSE